MTSRSDSSKVLVFISLGVAVVSLAVALFCFFSRKEIVYVDSLKLLSQYKGTLKAKAEYEKKVATWKANIDTLTQELTMEVARYEKTKAGLNPREKNLSEELIQTKQQQLEQYRRVVTENATKEDQQITSQVFQEIGNFVKQYGERHGYDYVMGATSAGNIVYANKAKDITDEVLKELNAGK